MDVNFWQSVNTAELSWPEVARPGNILSIFWKTTPYCKIFNFCSESLHDDID